MKQNKIGILVVAMLIMALTALTAFAIPYPTSTVNPLGTQWSGGGRTTAVNAVDIGFYKGSDFKTANGFASIMYDARSGALSKGHINVVGVTAGTRPTTYTYNLDWNSAIPQLQVISDTTTKTKFMLVASEAFTGAPVHNVNATFTYMKATKTLSVVTDYAKLSNMVLTTAYLG